MKKFCEKCKKDVKHIIIKLLKMKYKIIPKNKKG